jgi:hypothetical protein
MTKVRITSVRFSRYKAFESFQIALHDFNVLVGPNNAGEVDDYRRFPYPGEGLHRAKARNPTPIDVNGVGISDGQIAVQFQSREVHPDIRDLVEELASFSASESQD